MSDMPFPPTRSMYYTVTFLSNCFHKWRNQLQMSDALTNGFLLKHRDALYQASRHSYETVSCRLIFYISMDQFNPFPNKPWCIRVCCTSLLKTLWEKDKLLVKSNFSFSHSVFFSLGELDTIFIKFEIVVCKFFQFGRV